MIAIWRILFGIFYHVYAFMCCACNNIETLPLMEDSLSLERVSFIFTTKFCAKVKAFLGHEYSWTHFLSLSCEVDTNQHV